MTCNNDIHGVARQIQKEKKIFMSHPREFYVSKVGYIQLRVCKLIKYGKAINKM